MARYGRDFRHGRDFDSHPRGMWMGPGWNHDHDSDPNFRGGEYHGMRMGSTPGYQAAYGRQRMHSAGDLGGYGGYDGRYDLPEGVYDREGYYHERDAPRMARGPRYGADYRPEWEGGGVRGGREYLRQYNANSPALRGGGPERAWGFSEGPDARSMRGRDARGQRTDERGYNGYNQGGFSEGKFAGPGTRGSIPQR